MGTFTNYEMMAHFMEKAKNKEVGRPLPASMRMKMDKEGKITVSYGSSSNLFVVTPDNVLTFVATPQQLTFRASYIYKVLNFTPYRIGVNKFRVIPAYRKRQWPVDTKGYPDYFQGIQFSLPHGECLNRQDYKPPEVDKEARRVWLSALRNFKKAVAVRVKLGVIDCYVAEVKAIGRGLDAPWVDFTDKHSLDWLAEEITSKNVTTKLLRQVTFNAYRVHNSWRQEFTSAVVLKYMDTLINHNRTALRQRFNVFK